MLSPAPQPHRAWKAARNVLCVRLDSLGDVLMTTPALRAVKESGARRRVTLLTSRAGSALDGMLPMVDETIVYEAPWMKATPPRTTADDDLKMIAELRRRRFDAAIIFTVFSQNPLPAALMCMLAEIPLRLAHCRENPYQLLTDWAPEVEPQEMIRHEVTRQLALTDAVGFAASDLRLALAPPLAARAAMRTWVRRQELVGGRWIVCHPGASAASRRYPPELFAQALGILCGEHRLQVVFTGSVQEVALVESIRRRLPAPALSLAGALDVGHLAALIEQAPLLLTNNTGPAHIAAAVGTPVVDLYALTNPQHTPWHVPQRVLSHDVPCKNCFRSVCPHGGHECLTLIAPQAVAEAVVELLAKTCHSPTRFLERSARCTP